MRKTWLPSLEQRMPSQWQPEYMEVLQSQFTGRPGPHASQRSSNAAASEATRGRRVESGGGGDGQPEEQPDGQGTHEIVLFRVQLSEGSDPQQSPRPTASLA